MKPGAAAFIWPDIDLSAVIGDNPFAQGQADTGTLKALPGIQPLEDQEYPLRESGIDANALIGKDDLAIRELAVKLRMRFQFVRRHGSRRDIDQG